MGIAIGAGTDIAIEAAGMVLMKSDLRDVVTAMDLSKKIPPMLAGFLMIFSSISVVLSSLELRRYKKPQISRGNIVTDEEVLLEGPKKSRWVGIKGLTKP